jgi:FlaG/FlaF family flagellin (archaellin)
VKVFGRISAVKTVSCLSAAILSLLLPAFAQAELKWDQTTLDLQPPTGAKEAIGHFKYQNVGDKPVHFKSVKTSCGCTAAQTQKDQVEPGEKGEITATFKVGDRTGAQMKTITVETDDPAHAVTTLTLKANIVAILDLQPNFVYWQANEEAKAKTIVAKVGKDIPITKLDVVSSSSDFTVKVEQSKAAGGFLINVQPKETAKASFATLTIKPDYPKDEPKPYYAMARVTATPPPTANR